MQPVLPVLSYGIFFGFKVTGKKGLQGGGNNQLMGVLGTWPNMACHAWGFN